MLKPIAKVLTRSTLDPLARRGAQDRVFPRYFGGLAALSMVTLQAVHFTRLSTPTQTGSGCIQTSVGIPLQNRRRETATVPAAAHSGGLELGLAQYSCMTSSVTMYLLWL